MTQDLEAQFHEEMLDVYERAKRECNYNAHQFRTMVNSPLRGLGTAKALLKAPRVQSGFEKLWMLGRLDISMECRILNPKYAELFEPEELKEARIRLQSADYDVRKCYGQD